MLRVLCGWCGLVMCAGSAPTPVSHGCCPACLAKLMAERDRLKGAA